MITLFSGNYSDTDFEALLAAVKTGIDVHFRDCADSSPYASPCAMCDHNEACADLLRFERYLASKISGN